MIGRINLFEPAFRSRGRGKGAKRRDRLRRAPCRCVGRRARLVVRNRGDNQAAAAERQPGFTLSGCAVAQDCAQYVGGRSVFADDLHSVFFNDDDRASPADVLMLQAHVFIVVATTCSSHRQRSTFGIA